MTDRVASHCKSGTLVVFAGAGISMPPPTCLPGWKAVNEIILDALADRIVVFTDDDFAKELGDALVATRNATTWFTPDYHAQLIEDEVGHDYFRVLQALDTDDRNACHEAIAALAAGGCLSAIVTTNFDRLLERALDAAGVDHHVFFEPDHLDALPSTLAANSGSLPVIKVHGSVESPGSMVDTLRQRLMGRPAGLEQALLDLMARNHVLFAGFSGADLAYDPEYLGLRRAAERNQGFTCLVRAGDEPVNMRSLATSWGSGAQLIEGSLPEFLAVLAAGLGLPVTTLPAVAAVDRTPAVTAHAQAWAESLGHMVTASIMASLLDSSGRGELAFELLRRTLRSSARQRDMEATGYASFNYQLGHRLLERGKFDYDVDWLQGRKVARQNTSETWAYSPYTANDCFQCLNRATTLLKGQIDMGLYETYWGQPQVGAEHIRQARQQSAEQGAIGTFIDACLALGVVYEILMQYADALDWLEAGHRLASQLGDEPRRASLCAELARFLSMKERHDEAHQRVLEGLAVADRLNLQNTRLELLSAQGSVLIQQRRTAEALAVLNMCADSQRATGRRPSLTRTLIDICYGHFQANDWSAMEAATDELIDLTEVYLGYQPLMCLMRARFAVWLGLSDDTQHWTELTKNAAEAYQNPGVLEEVTLLADGHAPT